MTNHGLFRLDDSLALPVLPYAAEEMNRRDREIRYTREQYLLWRNRVQCLSRAALQALKSAMPLC